MPKKILVLDNDPKMLDMMQEVLTYEGFEVQVFEGTDDILSLVNKCKPDLLIIDYILNGITGGELCQHIKNGTQTKNLPVIIFSAYPKMLQKLGYYGCDAFIAKPFDLAELIEKVSELIATEPKLGINTLLNEY